MLGELRDKPRKYIRPGVDNTLVSPALEEMAKERLVLTVEFEVLSELYATKPDAQAAN